MDQAMKKPMHLWVVGILSLIWNGFGGYDYWMTRSRNTDYLASMMPGSDPNEVLAYIDSFPIWAQAGWGFGVWGGVLGSLLLLGGSRWAVHAFALSLLGAIVGLGYQMLGPPAPAVMSEGAGAIMPWVIIGVAALLLYYSYRQRANGVLR